MDEMTARERFVEAMRHFLTDSDHWSVREDGGECCNDRLAVAVYAFADAECGELVGVNDSSHYVETGQKHSECRASLRRECGLEGKT